MTTNQMDMTSSKFDNLSISKPFKPASKPSTVISKTPQPQTPQKLSPLNTTNLPPNQHNSSNSPNDKPEYSQSEPNLQKITENMDNDNNNNIYDINNPNNPNNPNNDATLTGTAYDYASSYASTAYTYASSYFYPLPQQQQQQQQQQNNNNQNNNNENNNQNNKPNVQQNGKHIISNGTTNEHKYDASVPDYDKYPMKWSSTDAINSNLHSLLASTNASGINTEWTKHFSEPSCDTVLLRSLTYLHDGKKQIDSKSKLFDNSPIFRLAHVQAFKTEIMIDNIAMHPTSWYNQNISLDDMSCFTLIVHLQVKSIKTSFITYHILEGANKLVGYNSNGTPIIKNDPACTKLLDLILNCNNNDIINNRLKLIPRIVSGPYPVKRVVENRPVLLGNKVGQKYFKGSNYFEIDSRVDESMVAASIIRLCHKFAKRIVVDMAWSIQGENRNELPERLLCGCTIHNMDFSKCKDINYEMQNCPKLIYPSNKDEKKENNK